MVFSIFLIGRGMNAFAASSTSMFMSCICFANSSIQYIIEGKIQGNIGIAGSIVVVIFALGTRVWLYQRVLELGKSSVLMLFMVILIGMAIPANLSQVIPAVIKQHQEGKNIWAFKSLCN